MDCGRVTEPADDIEIGVVLIVSECAEHREHNTETDAKFRQGLDWELDQFVSGAAKGKRCDRIWKDGPYPGRIVVVSPFKARSQFRSAAAVETM